MAYKIGLVQMRCTDDAKENQAVAEEGIRAAAKKGAKVVCLPELYRSLYFCQSEDHANFALAEPIPGPSTKALGAIAKKLKIAIVGSLFERRTAGVYHNTAVVLDESGKHAGTYRKMHIPDDPLYYEKFYFTPGDLGFQAFDTKHGRIGTLVCWDQWYPEAARLTALRGPSVIFYPTFGASFICDPYGRMIAEASRDKAEVLVAEVDPTVVETARQHWPFLRDRRIDAYGPITERSLEKR